MANRDTYMNIAKQIADYLNAFRLAFKTYHVSDLDKLIKDEAGEGARISGESTSEDFEKALSQRGFITFPTIAQASADDKYFRVLRANSTTASLLNALRYPGPNGDAELAKVLRNLKKKPRPDDDDDDE